LPQPPHAIAVTNGASITVVLGFVQPFPGAGRWLRAGRADNGGSTPSPRRLTPRHPFKAAPYITASNGSAIRGAAYFCVHGRQM